MCSLSSSVRWLRSGCGGRSGECLSPNSDDDDVRLDNDTKVPWPETPDSRLWRSEAGSDKMEWRSEGASDIGVPEPSDGWLFSLPMLADRVKGHSSAVMLSYINMESESLKTNRHVSKCVNHALHESRTEGQSSHRLLRNSNVSLSQSLRFKFNSCRSHETHEKHHAVTIELSRPEEVESVNVSRTCPTLWDTKHTGPSQSSHTAGYTYDAERHISSYLPTTFRWAVIVFRWMSPEPHKDDWYSPIPAASRSLLTAA